MSGCDIPDGSGEEAQFDAYRPKASGEGDYATMAWAMRNAAKRVCYSIAHSNAMNGIAKGTVMVPVTPWWAEALQVTKMVSLLLLLASAAWAVVYHVQLARRKKQ